MAKIIKAEHKATPLATADCETGGLLCQKNAMTEISLITVRGDTFEEIGRYESMIKPYGSFTYEEAALKITGIQVAALEEKGQDVKTVCREIVEMLDFAKQAYGDGKSHKPVLCGHNIGFDIGFIQQIFNYTGMIKDLEKVLQGKIDYYGNFQPLHIDTISLSKLAWSNDRRMANYKLETCVNRAGIGLNDAHRAINDTIATKDLVVNMAKYIRIGEKGGGSITPGEVVESGRKHFKF